MHTAHYGKRMPKQTLKGKFMFNFSCPALKYKFYFISSYRGQKQFSKKLDAERALEWEEVGVKGKLHLTTCTGHPQLVTLTVILYQDFLKYKIFKK